VNDLLARLIALYRAEPVRVNAFVVNLIVVAAAYFKVVIDPETVWQVAAVVGLITGAGELARRNVSPVAQPEPAVEVDGDPDNS
jgi:hypothetical protein